MMTVLDRESVVDRESVQKDATRNAHRILNAIWINIAARRSSRLNGHGAMIIVLKLVLAKFVELTAIAGREMNAAFLVNVLNVAVWDVLIILTVVRGITAVRKDSGMNLANVVQAVSENLVVQTMIVVVQTKLVPQTTNAQWNKTATHPLFHHG